MPTASIADNLTAVRERIAAAAARSGRAAEAVRLVAVTKYVGLDEIHALLDAGCLDLGESRPQQLQQRAAELAGRPVRWHLIGHLQRNKARKTIGLTTLIHSVDNLRLAEAISSEAAAIGRPVEVLLEVNVSGEASKDGLSPDELTPLLPQLARLSGLRVRGLMCMAALDSGAEGARRDFARLRELRDRLRGDCPPDIVLDELSMGMSGDFEAAIEEGATIVRVGSALFEGRS